MAIARTQDLVKYLDLGRSNAARVDSPLLKTILDETIDFVEMYTGRKFSSVPTSDSDDPVTKTFKVRRCRYVRVPDLRSVETMTLNSALLTEGVDFDLGDGTDEEPATYVKLTRYATAYSQYTAFAPIAYSTLSITGRWGWVPVPKGVKGLTLKLAARRYRERDAMWSDAVQTPEGAVFNFYASMPEAQKLNLYRVPRIGLVY